MLLKARRGGALLCATPLCFSLRFNLMEFLLLLLIEAYPQFMEDAVDLHVRSGFAEDFLFE